MVSALDVKFRREKYIPRSRHFSQKLAVTAMKNNPFKDFARRLAPSLKNYHASPNSFSPAWRNDHSRRSVSVAARELNSPTRKGPFQQNEREKEGRQAGRKEGRAFSSSFSSRREFHRTQPRKHRATSRRSNESFLLGLTSLLCQPYF